MKQYDYVLVDGGLYSGVWAYKAAQAEKKCLVVGKGSHLGGNVYREDVEGIHVHKYGAHIFHISNREVWDFAGSLVEFNRYTNSPVANYKGGMYNMSFNMSTSSKTQGISTPGQAKAKTGEWRASVTGEPKNLKGQTIRLVETDVYEKLVKEYTEKQRGRDCKEPPVLIIKCLSVWYTHDNNYFSDLYRGISVGGYNIITGKLFEGCDVKLGVDYLANREHYDSLGETVVYIGVIDAYFGRQYGKLGYRSLRFETEVVDTDNYQGVVVVNYTDKETPYTRAIEYKHSGFGTQPKPVTTRKYPSDREEGVEPYYPVNDEKNQELYGRYAKLVGEVPHVIFGGRLGEYKYYNMDKAIESAPTAARKEFGK